MNKIELVIVLGITVIVVLVWVASDVFSTHQPVSDDTSVQSLLEPVSTSFDQDTLNKIGALSQAAATAAPTASSAANFKETSPSPTPKITPNPVASASASATPAF